MFLLENQRNFLKTVPFPTLSPEELGLLEHTVSLLVRSLLLLESWQLIINKTKKISFQLIQYSQKVTSRLYIIPYIWSSKYETYIVFVVRKSCQNRSMFLINIHNSSSRQTVYAFLPIPLRAQLNTELTKMLKQQ